MSLDSKSWRKKLRSSFASFQQECFRQRFMRHEMLALKRNHFFLALLAAQLKTFARPMCFEQAQETLV